MCIGHVLGKKQTFLISKGQQENNPILMYCITQELTHSTDLSLYNSGITFKRLGI